MIVVHAPVLKAFNLLLQLPLVAKMAGILAEHSHTVAFLEKNHMNRLVFQCLPALLTSRCSK